MTDTMALLEASGRFPPDEIVEVGSVVTAYLDGTLDSDHFGVIDDDGDHNGPTPMSL